MRLKKWTMVLGFTFLAAQVSGQETPELKTQKEKTSYVIGVDLGRNFKRLGIDVDMDILAKGMKDVYSGEKLLMSEKDLRAIMNAHFAELKAKQEVAMRKTAADNKKEGDAFLAKNKTKKGVVTLPSGLQYRIIKTGHGKIPTDTDTVVCHYRGTLIDGTEFDSSYQRGSPSTFLIGGAIPGWREALKLMPVGSTWELFVPPELAYGARGASREIGPNATLIFELELLACK